MYKHLVIKEIKRNVSGKILTEPSVRCGGVVRWRGGLYTNVGCSKNSDFMYQLMSPHGGLEKEMDKMSG